MNLVDLVRNSLAALWKMRSSSSLQLAKPNPSEPEASPPSPPQKVLREINYAGLALIKKSEGLSLTAYQDTGKVWTIGYGHTPSFNGQVIDLPRAEKLLQDDLAAVYRGLEILLSKAPPLNSNQYSALCCFCFNLGCTKFATSTLLAYLEAGRIQDASNEFPKWNHDDGKVVKGLTDRRYAERSLFLS